MSHEFSIHSEISGESGHSVVFLHGLFGQGKNFTQIAKGLQPELRSLLVDLPNHGGSDWTDQFDYVEQADLVAEKLHSVGADEQPVHLVGHSMGGKVAMVLALRHPQLIDRLAIVDISPAARKDMDEFEHLLDALLDLPLQEIDSRGEADQRLQEAIPEDMVRGFLLQSLTRTSEGFAWRPNLRLLRSSLPVIGDFPDLTDKQFEGPVLWIAGENSDYVADEYAPAMRELFPRTRLSTIKNAGHWVHAEQPQVFTALLKSFLT